MSMACAALGEPPQWSTRALRNVLSSRASRVRRSIPLRADASGLRAFRPRCLATSLAPFRATRRHCDNKARRRRGARGGKLHRIGGIYRAHIGHILDGGKRNFNIFKVMNTIDYCCLPLYTGGIWPHGHICRLCGAYLRSNCPALCAACREMPRRYAALWQPRRYVQGPPKASCDLGAA